MYFYLKTKNIKDKIIHNLSRVCLLGIFLLGVLTIPEDLFAMNDSSIRSIGIGICLVVFSVSQLFLPSKKINFHSVDIWWMILIVFTGFSALWSLNGSYAIYGCFSTILLYCCFSAFQSSEIRSDENINSIFWTSTILFLSILIMLSAAIFTYMGAENLQDFAKNKYSYALFKNSDILISIALLLAPYIAFTSKNVHKAIAPTLFIITSIIILTIQPLKAALVLVFLASIYILFNAKLKQINKYLILGGAIIVLFAGLIYGPVDKVVLASQTKFTQESVDQNDRIQLWRNSMRLTKRSPFIGHGSNNWELAVGQFGYGVYKIPTQVISPKLHRYSHSIVSQVLSELGLIGFIAVLYIAVLPCLRLINERVMLSKLEVAALVSVSTFFLLGIIYGTPLSYYKDFQGIVLIFVIGLAIISTKSNLSTTLFTTHNKAINLMILVGAMSTIIYFGRISHGETLQEKAVTAIISKDYETSEKLATKALEIIPESKNYQILFESLVQQNKNTRATQVIKEALRKDPHNAILLYTHADHIFSLGNIDKAILLSKKAFKVAPNYLYNKALSAKCVFIKNPQIEVYRKLLKIDAEFTASIQLKDPEIFTPENLKLKNVKKDFSQFINDNKSKIRKSNKN